jgi:hypothetical protein
MWLTDPSQLEYPAIRLGCGDRMQFDQLKRRAFIRLLGGAAVGWPLAARAQQDAKIARIGFLGLAPASVFITRLDALRAGLREVGQIEGKNIEIEFRWADSVDQLPQLAAELVRMNVDIIFAPASTFVEPARQATKTIPIVFANHADPLGTGHVATLARPGGNITGLSVLMTDLAANRSIFCAARPSTARTRKFHALGPRFDVRDDDLDSLPDSPHLAGRFRRQDCRWRW